MLIGAVDLLTEYCCFPRHSSRTVSLSIMSFVFSGKFCPCKTSFQSTLVRQSKRSQTVLSSTPFFSLDEEDESLPQATVKRSTERLKRDKEVFLLIFQILLQG